MIWNILCDYRRINSQLFLSHTWTILPFFVKWSISREVLSSIETKDPNTNSLILVSTTQKSQQSEDGYQYIKIGINWEKSSPQGIGVFMRTMVRSGGIVKRQARSKSPQDYLFKNSSVHSLKRDWKKSECFLDFKEQILAEVERQKNQKKALQKLQQDNVPIK